MKPEIKQRWVEALRGGDYKQTFTGTLRHKEAFLETDSPCTFCVLGVLCDLYVKEQQERGHETVSWESKLKGYISLPLFVQSWAGLKGNDARDPRLYSGRTAMVYNDILRTPFPQLADLIEKNL